MRKRSDPGNALLVLAVLLANACRAGESSPGICDARLGPANLNFTLGDAAGKAVDLRDFRGRVILINFWATWCAPCRTEIPWLVELFKEHRQAGLVVLGVSVDEDVARIAPFAASLRMDFPVLVGRDEGEFRESFGPLLGFPTTLLITRAGDICLRHTGITQRAKLHAEVQALLAAD
jgi:peroxiredoxin